MPQIPNWIQYKIVFFFLQWPCTWIYLIAPLQNQRTVPEFHHIYIKTINPTNFESAKLNWKLNFETLYPIWALKVSIDEHIQKNKPVSLLMKQISNKNSILIPKNKKTDPSKFIGRISDLQSTKTQTHIWDLRLPEMEELGAVWERRWEDWRISRVCKVLQEGTIYRVMCSTRPTNIPLIIYVYPTWY